MRGVVTALVLVALAAPAAMAADFAFTGFSWYMFPSTGGAFNPNTGMLWFHEHYMGVMHEYRVDGTPTGVVVQTPGDPDYHGLAYNPMTDHFWGSEAGGTTVWEFTSGGAVVSSFSAATSDQCGLAVDTNTGNIYWTSYSYGSVIEYTPSGQFVRQFGYTSSPLSLEYLGCPNTLLVSNSDGTRLEEWNLDGTVINSWDIASMVGTSVRIRSMAYDSLNGYLYVANEHDYRVYQLQDRTFQPSATAQGTWGQLKMTFK